MRTATLPLLLALTIACGDKDEDSGSAYLDDGTTEPDGGTGDEGGTDGEDGATDGGEDGGDDGGEDGGDDGATDEGGDDGGADEGGTDDGGDEGAMDEGGEGAEAGEDGSMDEGGEGAEAGEDGSMDEGGEAGTGDEGSGDEGGEDEGGDDSGASTGTGSGSGGSGSGGSGSGGSGGSGSGGSGGSGSSSTDTDGDGQTDADELAAGTDPNDYFDRSYTGAYNVATCGTALPTASTPSGPHNGRATTYATGDIVANFQLVDQNGDDVDLYSFCDNHVMLVFSAMWCGSCKSVAANAQTKQNSYASSGFQYIEVLVEDTSSGTIEPGELGYWASTYSLSTVPVVDDDSRTAHELFERNWSYPTIVHLGAGTMEVLSVDGGQQDPSGWL